MRKLGRRQLGVLEALEKHGYWHNGAGWFWTTVSETEKILRSLEAGEYVFRRSYRNEENPLKTYNVWRLTAYGTSHLKKLKAELPNCHPSESSEIYLRHSAGEK